MLNRNIFQESSTLVNGLFGKVERFSSGGPVIKYETCQLHCMKVTDFPIHDDKGHVVANQRQLHLQLSFATTIHKVQGMILENVQLSLAGLFEPGKLFVALSRARNQSDLQILPGSYFYT